MAARRVGVRWPKMRERWFCRRAFFLHFLLVTVVPGCLFAGWWQVHRALSGNLLSYLYSVEWPFFALLGVVAWWQLIHDAPVGHWLDRSGPPKERKSWLYHQDNSEGPEVQRDRALESPDLVAYNGYLQSLAGGKAKKTWGNPRGLPFPVEAQTQQAQSEQAQTQQARLQGAEPKLRGADQGVAVS